LSPRHWESEPPHCPTCACGVSPVSDELRVWECAFCKHWTMVKYDKCACCGKGRVRSPGDVDGKHAR
jgi:hypothetical protein